MANLQKTLTRKHSVLVDDIFVQAMTDQERYKKVAHFYGAARDLKVVLGDFYFDMDWFDEIMEKYSKEKNVSFYSFMNDCYYHAEKLISFASARNLVDRAIKEPKKYFDKSVELLKDLTVFLTETHPLVKVVERRVLDILKNKKIKGDDLNEALLEFSLPAKKNTPVLEVENLYRIKKIIEASPVRKKELIDKHLARFAFLGYREPFSLGYSYAFISSRLKNLPARMAHGAIHDIKLTKSEQEQINLLKELVYFRNFRTEKIYEALFYLEPTWNAIGRRFGLRSNEIGYYLLSEVDDLLSANKTVSSQTIKERRAGHGFLVKSGKISFLSGQELVLSLERTGGDVAKKLTGMIACKGKVIGRAKIVMRSKDQTKVKHGDILVTSMTTPDYLPSMHRAVAFVTDEGGITCHAAIVARELGKPCLIGTKVATKILKDGDIVEVDADRGVVKIIK